MLHKRAMGAITLGVATLGGLASWQALGWPRPLVKSDLQPISRGIEQATATAETALELGKSNNRRILQNDWWRYDREIDDIRDLIDERPKDRRLRENLRRLRREQAEIQDQIERLDR